jgi:hypothetical protein
MIHICTAFLTIQNPSILPSHEEITIVVLEFCVLYNFWSIFVLLLQLVLELVLLLQVLELHALILVRPDLCYRGGEHSTTWNSLDAFD